MDIPASFLETKAVSIHESDHRSNKLIKASLPRLFHQSLQVLRSFDPELDQLVGSFHVDSPLKPPIEIFSGLEGGLGISIFLLLALAGFHCPEYPKEI